jgi:alpha-beta hydrolase superfamily lysophospholipase
VTRSLRPDILGRPYYAETIPLPPDEEGEVVATLVRRKVPRRRSRKAVLHVHGFCDYFFQTAAADFWVEQGYDFYAIDLRKYGRSLRPHQTPNYAADLAEYDADLTAAMERIVDRDAHEHVLVSGHSTGGLIALLWAERSRPDLAGMFLNAPWVDLKGSFWLRTAGTKALDQLGVRRPRQEIPRSVSGLYTRSLHRDHDGEWDFDLSWKPVESWPVYAGWLRAVRRGHAAVQRGLSLDVPVLVMSSARSATPRSWGPEATSSDIVLDVAQIARHAPKLSSHVTMVRVPDALHDITLSRAEVRERVFDELRRWLMAYVD